MGKGDDGTEQGERLLAQRSVGWKLACSSWVLVVALGFVLFSVLGWALGAVLARSRRMCLWTLAWGGLYAVAGIAMETDSDAGFLVFFAIWMGSIAHAGALARGVLRSRAVALHRDAGYRRASPEPSAPAQPDLPAIPLPDGMRPLGDVHDGR